jgi:hypothetical protein
VRELAAAGAEDPTPVTVRDRHHITWNNCLVESSDTVGRHAYLPTYGHGDDADLALVDRHMTRTFQSSVSRCTRSATSARSPGVRASSTASRST